MTFIPGTELAAFAPDGSPVLVSLDDVAQQTGAKGVASALSAQASQAAQQIEGIRTELLAAGASARADVGDLFAQLQVLGGFTSNGIYQAQVVSDGLAATIEVVQTSVAANTAAISSETTARASEDSALAGQIDTVTTTANGNTVAITSESAARSSADTALGGRIDSVTATASGNSSAISSEIAARASADSALGTRIDTVTATAAGNTAAISSETSARASGDAALAGQFSTLSSTVGSNTAAINSEAATRASADSAFAGQLTSVNSRVGAAESSVSFLLSASNGNQAVAQLTLDANNVVTGFKVNGQTSTFAIEASTFVIEGRNPFSYDSNTGILRLPSVAVDTLVNNTAVIPIVSTSSTPTNGTSTQTNAANPPNAYVTLFQKTITVPAPGLIRLECNLKQNFTGSLTSVPWQLYLSVNGNQLPESVESGSVPGDSVTSVGFYYAAQAGTYTLAAIWGAHTSIVAEGRSFAGIGFAQTTVPPDTSDGGNYTPSGSSGSSSGASSSSGGGGGGRAGGGFTEQQQ